MKHINEYLSSKALIKTIKTTIEATDSNIRKIIDDEIKKNGPQCDLNHIDTSKVTNMNDLFMNTKGRGLDGFNCDISRWDVHNVKAFSSMFYMCYDFTGDLSGWDVSAGEEFIGMFERCTKFNSDLNNWDMSNAKNLDGMFHYAETFNKPLYKWDISNVVYTEQMFDNAKSFNQDISNWNIRSVTNAHNVFRDCPIRESYKPTAWRR